MRRKMEVNNVSIDPRDNIYRNYFAKTLKNPVPRVEIPDFVKDKVSILECNKRTNLSCIAALEIDVLKVTR